MGLSQDRAVAPALTATVPTTENGGVFIHLPSLPGLTQTQRVLGQ